MRVIFVLTFSLVALAGGKAVAQEGHPLKGSWIGTWTGNKTHGDDVLFVINWDGKAITGMIDPGTDNIAIKTVRSIGQVDGPFPRPKGQKSDGRMCA